MQHFRMAGGLVTGIPIGGLIGIMEELKGVLLGLHYLIAISVLLVSFMEAVEVIVQARMHMESLVLHGLEEGHQVQD